MSALISSAESCGVHNHDEDYAALLSSIQNRFAAASKSGRIFRTTAGDLFSTYMDHLPGEHGVHNCRACRHFIDRFGGLVSIDENGVTESAVWDEEQVPRFYKRAVIALRKAVEAKPVSGVMISSEKVFGTPKTGEWTHLSLTNHHIHRNLAASPDQAMAAKAEDFRTIQRALAEFKTEALDEAVRVLKADVLTRSERFVGPAGWLRNLKVAVDKARGRQKQNLVWRAIADAPAGYCHPRSSVIGSLLEDIEAGFTFAEVKARFAFKLDPNNYQRPQAPPSAGNIARAENLVEKLGIARALERRFARRDELLWIWAPKSDDGRADNGFFGHLKTPAPRRVMSMPTIGITWEKFRRTVLPHATEMKALITQRMPLMALVTAVHADAPAIIKWDDREYRNPVSWYVYPNLTDPRAWGLQVNVWADVSAISELPTMWGPNPRPFIAEGVVLLIDGARDRNNDSLGLFPEILREELHEVRSTIEAYSKSRKLEGFDRASACGIDIRKVPTAYGVPHRVKVKVSGDWTFYDIRQWD